MLRTKRAVNTEINELLCIQEMSNGKVSAFNALYNQYHRSVHANILKLVKSPDLSSEILQEVFISLWQNRNKLNRERSVGGWLFVVSFNKSINALKQRLKESKSYLEEINKEFAWENNSVFEEEKYDLQLKILEEAVNKLSPRKKEVFKLYHYDGLSKAEVATKLGISHNSVNDYLKQSNKNIRKYVSMHHPEYFEKAFYLLLFLMETY